MLPISVICLDFFLSFSLHANVVQSVAFVVRLEEKTNWSTWSSLRVALFKANWNPRAADALLNQLVTSHAASDSPICALPSGSAAALLKKPFLTIVGNAEAPWLKTVSISCSITGFNRRGKNCCGGVSSVWAANEDVFHLREKRPPHSSLTNPFAPNVTASNAFFLVQPEGIFSVESQSRDEKKLRRWNWFIFACKIDYQKSCLFFNHHISSYVAPEIYCIIKMFKCSWLPWFILIKNVYLSFLKTHSFQLNPIFHLQSSMWGLNDVWSSIVTKGQVSCKLKPLYLSALGLHHP